MAAQDRLAHCAKLHRQVKSRHFIVKMIILPRQARDKHRESSPKKDGVFISTVRFMEEEQELLSDLSGE